jgi:hypothetical protein
VWPQESCEHGQPDLAIGTVYTPGSEDAGAVGHSTSTIGVDGPIAAVHTFKRGVAHVKLCTPSKAVVWPGDWWGRTENHDPELISS